jgi:AmmeMemoRadiSam system protein B/AmmeMemoRadiSam system protein A
MLKRKFFKIMVVIMLIINSFFNNTNAQDYVPQIAGTFYPDNPQVLESTIQQYLEQAGTKVLKSKPFGMIVPHAGLPYSGPVAAYAYKEIVGEHYDAIVIMGPSHRNYFPYAAVYSGDYYKTSLGEIPIAKKLAADLSTKDQLVRLSAKEHIGNAFTRGENSIEIQVPFIQIISDEIPIIPILVGTMDLKVLKTLGKQLAQLARKFDILILASSDLSHYHIYFECKAIDQKFIDCLLTKKPDNLYYGIKSEEFEACGSGPVYALMVAAEELDAYNVEVLNYANSGDVPHGDKSQVVGYLSAAFIHSEEKPKQKEQTSTPESGELNIQEQEFLMNLAEQTVKAVVKGEKIKAPTDIPPICQEKRGAFVTLTKRDQLRGCIGYILPYFPLYKTVMEVAESATLKDSRFSPVSEKELSEIDVEISVLTVPQIIKDINQIEVGTHGLIIKKGPYQGLLLPQVATEYGWDRDTFLAHTCQKAGLPSMAWKDADTEIQIFSAQVFNRETLQSVEP